MGNISFPYRTPSTLSLSELTRGDMAIAREVKRLLLAPRLDLEAFLGHDADEVRYGHPTQYLRMAAVDRLIETHGVETFRTRRRNLRVIYCNAGDTYAATLLRVGRHYRVGCWGDIAERYGVRD